MYRIRSIKQLYSIPQLICNCRSYSTGAVPTKTRHLLSTADLSVPELKSLLSRSAELKHSVKTRNLLPGLTQFTPGPLAGQSVAMMFSKRSTRTRVSTESAVALLGGHPMFLGKDDIQLGVVSGRKPLIIGERVTI
jgi:ornithine carbamoyltransferase